MTQSEKLDLAAKYYHALYPDKNFHRQGFWIQNRFLAALPALLKVKTG